MVLLAAVAIAVALVPMVLAYLQLGYHADVTAPAPDRALEAERALQGAVESATDEIPANYTWRDRRAAVTTVRDRLAPSLESLNRSAVAAGTAYLVIYNASRAATWEARNCPSGPNRQFGPCRADRGVVVQERAGETHVLAVAFDVRLVTRTSESRLWYIVT